MGTEAHLVVTAAGHEHAVELAEQARQRVADLESRWSRFLPNSELSRLNQSQGRPTVVSPETFQAVGAAVEGWYLTGGRYDPTILAALEAAGYDRTFLRVVPASADRAGEPVRAPGCAGITLMPTVNAVLLPPGVTLDLGGVGKGLGADLVATELLSWGATGACVNLGGDVRVKGVAPDGCWRVAVEDPFDETVTLFQVALADGAVVTTTRLTRQWQRSGQHLHHLIDPSTGAPATSGVASVTVVAAEAWRAEVLAKAAFLAGMDEGLELLSTAGVTGAIIGDDRRVLAVAGLEAYV